MSSNDTRSQLDDVLALVKSLSIDQQAKLIKHLLKNNELTVILGNQLTTAELAMQIETAPELDVPQILRAVANWIGVNKK